MGGRLTTFFSGGSIRVMRVSLLLHVIVIFVLVGCGGTKSESSTTVASADLTNVYFARNVPFKVTDRELTVKLLGANSFTAVDDDDLKNVFLTADGDQTCAQTAAELQSLTKGLQGVSGFGDEFSNMLELPKKIPSIVRELSERGLVQLSDKPIKLPDSLYRPVNAPRR